MTGRRCAGTGRVRMHDEARAGAQELLVCELVLFCICQSVVPSPLSLCTRVSIQIFDETRPAQAEALSATCASSHP